MGCDRSLYCLTVRYKVAPEPRDLDFLEDAQRAVPLVPETVDDCCARLMDRTAVSSRDDAREYLTFLEALELVTETPRGYERERVGPELATLADAFERRVFGASELLDALAEAESLTVDEAFHRLREHVPRWERERRADWEREWRERTEWLLEWVVVFGLATRDGEGYRLADGS